jgi:hypothetical protein
VWDGRGDLWALVCQQARETLWTPTQYPNMVDYKGRTGHHHLPSTPQSWNTVIFAGSRVPEHHACVQRNYLYPPGSWPYGSTGKGYRQTRRNNEPHPNLALLLLIQVIWMFKLKVELVKVITHKLYASSYIMIITLKQLYSSLYALLHEWYESMNLEELFIVVFIPRCSSSSKETSSPW